MIGIVLLLLIFLVVPAAEISVFIAIGSEIGIFWTLFITIFTAIAGTFLLRNQGFSTIQKIKLEAERGQIPGNELVYGLMILLAGLLLLIPGFITDAIGLLLFIPPIRQLLWLILASRIDWTSFKFKSGRSGKKDGVLDLDEEEWELKAEARTKTNSNPNSEAENDAIEDKTNKS